MPFPAHLMQAVIAEPSKDQPRHAIATWCRDNGQALRAELIEKQLSLALRASNPDGQTFRLADETKALVKAHGHEWVRFDDLDLLIDDFGFDRGFVELVELSAESFIKHADTLVARSPIRHLNLNAVADFAEKVFQVPQLSQIVTLSLARNRLNDGHMNLLATSPYFENLRWLNLMLNDVGNSGAEALARSKGLKKLEFVNFFGNPDDPTEQFLDDQGFIVERILPPAGLSMEARLGTIPWLHPKAVVVSDLPPGRYNLAD